MFSKQIIVFLFYNSFTGITFGLCMQLYRLFLQQDKELQNLKHRVMDLERQVVCLQENFKQHNIDIDSKLEDYIHSNYELIT